MEERYSRNRLYMSEKEQSVIKDYKIFLGGAGIGSIVAECALRFGFEHITIVDGDKVEQSNLNRQNYTENDIGRYKAECLAERLLSINPDAQIDYHTEFLNPDNIEEMLNGHNVAINALDFKDKTPFVFDEICKERKIPVLHPYNFVGLALLRL
jgi:thiF family protein